MDLLDRYLHACGKSSVPQEFHYWAFLSLTAACVAQRVGFIREQLASGGTSTSDTLVPLAPNLFVMFVAPTGHGKSQAITKVQAIMTDAIRGPAITNAYQGKTSGPALVNYLGVQDGNPSRKPKVSHTWFVGDELASDIGVGGQAGACVSLLTSLYDKTGQTFKEHTRMSGLWTIQSPCINWLSGSTDTWAKKAVPADANDGGFWPRCIVCYREPSAQQQGDSTAILPDDYDLAMTDIRAGLLEVAKMHGRFDMLLDARKLYQSWKSGREQPKLAQKPFWNREGDHVLKVAMNLAIARGQELVIRRSYIEEAIEKVRLVAADFKELLMGLRQETPEGRVTMSVLQCIEEAGTAGATRTEVLKAHLNVGMTKKRLDGIIEVLTEMEVIREEVRRPVGGKGRTIVVYFRVKEDRGDGKGDAGGVQPV